MFIDALLRVCTAQAFTAAAVSASSVDLGSSSTARRIGTGEPVGIGVSVDVALNATSMLLEAISATDAALTTSVVSHGSRTILAADAAAGSLHFVEFADGTPTQRFVGLRATPTGGAATVTLTAQLTPADMFSIAQQNYPKNYAV